MTLEGFVVNGQIVLDPSESLPDGAKVRIEILEPAAAQDEWLRHLRSAATDCGVSLPNEAFTSEGLYD